MQHLDETTKHVMDALSIAAGWLALLVEGIPKLAPFLSVIWLVLRIYECETVKKWLKK